MNDHRRGPGPRQPDLGNREQTRRLKRAMERSATEVIRCQHCGHQQVAESAFIAPRTQCEKCSTNLHSCRHCVHFDTSTLHQCRETIETPVGDKWSANGCKKYKPRLVLDSTGRRHGGRASKDPKSMFDSLFK